jgi:uncharacterized protein YbjT (DUF2867 family)
MITTIITGASGMVGEGVLLTCLSSPDVTKVLVVGRRTCGHRHPKLTELLLPDLADLSTIESQLRGYDACFFCAGVSSVGKSEAEYTRLTYNLTMSVAKTLARLNSGMTFTYVSGTGTDESEQGRVMWARVKGRTENDLRKLGFKASYAFRPGLMKPVEGQHNSPRMLMASRWLYPVFKVLSPKHVSTLEDVGRAMIKCVIKGYEKPVLENRDIGMLART